MTPLAQTTPCPRQADDMFSRSILPFMWFLIRSMRPANTRRDLGRSLEYVLRLLPFLPWVLRLKSIFTDPLLQPVLLGQPAMLDKLRRPYQDRRVGLSQRLNLIASHYRWQLSQFKPAAMAAIYQPEGYLLGHVRGAAQVYTLHLLFDRLYDKEGELMLALVLPDDERVATLAFCVADQPGGGRIMRIGCLQGGASGSRDLFKQITKDCHGLRPLALLVNAAQLLADIMGLSDVRAIGSAEHMYQHWRYRYKKIHQIQRHYDELWLELGGLPSDGWYALPVPPEQRDPADAPSHKRAMYNRRRTLLNSLHEELNITVAQARPAG